MFHLLAAYLLIALVELKVPAIGSLTLPSLRLMGCNYLLLGRCRPYAFVPADGFGDALALRLCFESMFLMPWKP